MPAKFVCEFAAGQDEISRSSVWRVWSAKNRPDLYLAVRMLSGTMKASVHAPRPGLPVPWRSYAFTSESTHPARYEQGGRHKLSWQGEALAPGYSIEWRIVIPGPALSPKGNPCLPSTTLL